MDSVTPEAWLNLGIPGAALFIVFVLVIFMFRQQASSVDKLCEKIDDLVTSFSKNNLQLNEVLLSNDRDQKEILHELAAIHTLTQDMHKKIVRIDVRLYDSLADGKKEGETNEQ